MKLSKIHPYSSHLPLHSPPNKHKPCLRQSSTQAYITPKLTKKNPSSFGTLTPPPTFLIPPLLMGVDVGRRKEEYQLVIHFLWTICGKKGEWRRILLLLKNIIFSEIKKNYE